MTRGGLPHSEISGSKLICSSPELIAACHVLHRLLAPRHSPYTLSSLTIRNSELTLTNRLHVSWSATVLCNTACVVVGKNYRLQNIQLSKITPGGFTPRPPLAHSPGPEGPAPFARFHEQRFACWSLLIAALAATRIYNVGSAIGAPPKQRSYDRSRRRRVRDLEARLTAAETLFSNSHADQLRRLRSAIGSHFGLRACRGSRSPRTGVGGTKAGGEYRARTGDLLVANQALSQLS